ncbi:MAG TPA: DUF3592 domain-containing protein [Anaerolineae bacterium]|nr:DUF3592 domain-containing protein [Anaerolineae bacterium]HQK12602.1 DUF3592 domain-containing protein [Anaerolineae bacterium]
MLVVFLVLLTLALPLFLYGTYYVARGILRGLRTADWRETPGVILLSNVAQLYRGKEVVKEVLQLSYAYRVDGVDYEGNRVGFKSFAWFFGNLDRLAAKYPKGQEVVVYYDPLHPEEAILEKGTARADGFLLAGLALLDAGILLIWIPLTPVLILLGLALIVFLVFLFRELKQNRFRDKDALPQT